MVAKQWSKGDRVVHAAKPEWGLGEILQAEPTSQDGRPCQRLVVRFDRAGMKTVSTAFAELKPAGDRLDTERTVSMLRDDESPLLNNGAAIEERMLKLPDSATDPFTTLAARLKGTLDLYRFGETPGGLLDWSSIQTGLKDPLTKFNRHELEQWFGRFKIVLDAHLKKLVRDARKSSPALLASAADACSPSAKQALRRADADR